MAIAKSDEVYCFRWGAWMYAVVYRPVGARRWTMFVPGLGCRQGPAGGFVDQEFTNIMGARFPERRSGSRLKCVRLEISWDEACQLANEDYADMRAKNLLPLARDSRSADQERASSGGC